MSVATVGLDIAKQFFQVHGVDANGRVVLRRTRGLGGVFCYLRKMGNDPSVPILP